MSAGVLKNVCITNNKIRIWRKIINSLLFFFLSNKVMNLILKDYTEEQQERAKARYRRYRERKKERLGLEGYKEYQTKLYKESHENLRNVSVRRCQGT